MRVRLKMEKWFIIIIIICFPLILLRQFRHRKNNPGQGNADTLETGGNKNLHFKC